MFFFPKFLHLGEKKGGGNGTKGFFLEKIGPNCHIMKRKKSQGAILKQQFLTYHKNIGGLLNFLIFFSDL
jgi:hypothetical protein